MNTNEIDTKKLATDLKRVVRDSEELLQASAGVMGDKANEIRERMTGALATAKATYRKLEETAVSDAKATDKVIREHPYESIGIAFGVGMLIGVLVARK